MTTGPDDRGGSPEPTFADVMNGFSLDSARSSKRWRWGRHRGPEVDLGDAAPVEEAEPDVAVPTGTRTVPPQGEDGAAAAAVRPYAWTRGRTKSGFDLAIEQLVSTSPKGRRQLDHLQMEHRPVAELCAQTRSVAEVAALLSLPLGVARVLLGDMAGLGVVTVHQTASNTGDTPDLALMERVLSGLRRL